MCVRVRVCVCGLLMPLLLCLLHLPFVPQALQALAHPCFDELRDKLRLLADEEKRAEAARAAREAATRAPARAPLWEARAPAAAAPEAAATPPRPPAPTVPTALLRRARPNNTCENRPIKRPRPPTPMLRFLEAPAEEEARLPRPDQLDLHLEWQRQ